MVIPFQEFVHKQGDTLHTITIDLRFKAFDQGVRHSNSIVGMRHPEGESSTLIVIQRDCRISMLSRENCPASPRPSMDLQLEDLFCSNFKLQYSRVKSIQIECIWLFLDLNSHPLYQRCVIKISCMHGARMRRKHPEVWSLAVKLGCQHIARDMRHQSFT